MWKALKDQLSLGGVVKCNMKWPIFQFAELQQHDWLGTTGRVSGNTQLLNVLNSAVVAHVVEDFCNWVGTWRVEAQGEAPTC